MARRPSGGVRTCRYQRKQTIQSNTIVLMETKVVVCRILLLICTIRLDVRVSLLLDLYQKKGITAGAVDRWPAPTSRAFAHTHTCVTCRCGSAA